MLPSLPFEKIIKALDINDLNRSDTIGGVCETVFDLNIVHEPKVMLSYFDWK